MYCAIALHILLDTFGNPMRGFDCSTHKCVRSCFAHVRGARTVHLAHDDSPALQKNAMCPNFWHLTHCFISLAGSTDTTACCMLHSSSSVEKLVADIS